VGGRKGQKDNGFPCEVLDLENEVGTIEPGKLADMIIVNGNPLDDISILQNDSQIALVMQGGQILKSTLPEIGRTG